MVRFHSGNSIFKSLPDFGRGYWVYVLIDPCTGDVKYVGISQFPRERLNSHMANARKGNLASSGMIEWIVGLLQDNKAPFLSVLTHCKKRKDALRIEREMIISLGKHTRLFNVTHNRRKCVSEVNE